MRILIRLSIAVFITTLYWPQLLSNSGLIYCAIVAVIFMCWSKWRYLCILPLTALYFSLFTYIVLFGGSTELTNNHFIHSSKYLSFLDDKKPTDFISPVFNDQDNSITVEVKSLINAKNRGYFVASVISINNSECNYCPLIEMRWYKPELQVQAGQIHQFKVRIKPLQGKANPDNFDRQKWRYSQHIAYIANIKKHISVIDEASSIRAKLYLAVLKLTQDMPQQGALIALVFADKTLMSTTDKETIKALGIAHLFAISGLHIGLMFIFAFVVTNFAVRKIFPHRLLGWFSWRLVHLISFFICLIYAYISGFSLPTQRALMMLAFTIFMLSSKRKISSFDLLVLCFWVILLIDPLATLSSSLWLSFTAMASILIFIWAIKRDAKVEALNLLWWKVGLRRIFIFIKWLLLMQLVLTLFMLPIQLINFSAISILSLLINLMAIPLFSWFIIPLTLLGTFSVVVSEALATFLFQVADRILANFLRYADNFSFAYIYLPEDSIKLILTSILLVLLFLFLIVFKRLVVIKKSKVFVLVGGLIAFVAIRLIELEVKNNNTWQVEVFDVGQGLSVLIKSNKHYLLYDTGASYGSGYSVANYTILPYLRARGIKNLDYLIISHSDNDHAGGRYVIEQNLQIKEAYAGEAKRLNESLPAQDLVYKQCYAGQSFALGELKVNIISPTELTKNNNDNSCVIKISDGINSVLLTGDISRFIEHQLVNKSVSNERLGNNAIKLQSDILIAPHHGSKTSSSVAFIKKVKPRWVVFTAGYKNRWRFPVPVIVERYTSSGIEQLTTGDTGFIRFNVQNQVIEVKTYRADLAAYWYHQQIAL